MGEHTTISWCDHTFNPWEGCTKVSPGCAHCYAETRNHRFGNDNWGKDHPRRRTSKANWFGPRRWNDEDPHTAQYRTRIFCASLADWLDDEVPIEWLADLLKLIHETPNCDWLLLTKRPENWRERVDGVRIHNKLGSLAHDAEYRETREMARKWVEDETYPENVWIGTSVEDQKRAEERIPLLLKIPARIRFLSVEPMLGPVNLTGNADKKAWPWSEANAQGQGINWVIFGGESGPGARCCHVDWIRDGLNQCRCAGVAPFLKQLGANIAGNEMDKWVTRIKDKKGGNMIEWPQELRVREFPQ